MAQDIYIDPNSSDWSLIDDTTLRLCETYEELTRQRVAINLRMFAGEWFADKNYGVYYFTSVFGKNTKNTADAIFKAVIRRTEGVTKLNKFKSTVSDDRKYSLVFSFTAKTGTITDVEVTI